MREAEEDSRVLVWRGEWAGLHLWLPLKSFLRQIPFRSPSWGQGWADTQLTTSLYGGD